MNKKWLQTGRYGKGWKRPMSRSGRREEEEVEDKIE